MTPSTDARTRVPPDVTAPAQRLLDGSLVLAPLAYLAPDRSYAVGGWDDGATRHRTSWPRRCTGLPPSGW